MTEPGGSGATGTAVTSAPAGGRFDFDDGGTFLGGWDEGKAHGHGVCTGPKGQGAYSGAWHYGFEVSGVYIWPSGSAYEGQWQNGKRHGLGVESRGRWMYRGEWSQGFKGRYGVRQSSTSNARYEGTWANGLQDGYGSETYADGGTYQGQWLRGMRHGYGVRASAPFGQASHYRPNKTLRASLTSLRSVEGGPEAQAAERDRRVDDSRGGFVLKAKSDDPPLRRRSLVERSSNIKKSILSGLKIKKQRSTGDLDKRGTSGGSIRSTGSSASWVSTESSQSGVTGSLHTDSNASFVVEDEHMDASVTETYLGEWKNDKRSGFGISERSDGLKYEGEWFNNKKYGYGVTTFRDGSKEEGKYKNNLLITSQKKKHLFLIRSAKFRERIDAAVNAAQRASKIALQKADIAISRTATARGKAEMADLAAEHAREDFEVAQAVAKQFAPDFVQPGLEKLRNRPPGIVKPPSQPNATANPSSTTVPNKTTTFSDDSYQQQNASYQPSGGASYQMPPTSTAYQQPNSSPYHAPPMQMTNSSFQNVPRQVNSSYQNIPANVGATNYGAPGSSGGTDASYQDYRQTNAIIHSTPEPQAKPQQGIGALVTQTSPLPPQVMTSSNGSQGTPSRDERESSYHHTVTPPTPLIPHDKPEGMPGIGASNAPNRVNTIRRNSRQVSGDSPSYNFQQAMSDHFDHYKRAPSRDPSMDRFSRGGSRVSGSRQPSVDKTTAGSPPPETPPPPSIAAIHAAMASSGGSRAPSLSRSSAAGNGSIGGALPLPRQTTPFAEEVATLKKRVPQTQEVIPSAIQPKRTESLLIPNNKPVGGAGGGGGGGGGPPPKVKSIPVTVNLQRKKSLDVGSFPLPSDSMSREEVSVLSSARREELRRMQDEAEKLRANPLLYLVSPNVKEWFSKQQLVMLVLFINISLAIMFYKLLT